MTNKASPKRAGQQKPVGELLWLAATAIAFAVVMGIVCWPLSAALMPRLAASVASGDRGASIAPLPDAADASPSALPASPRSVTPLPVPEAPPVHVDQTATDIRSGVASPAPEAAAKPSEVQPSPPVTSGPAPPARRPQHARSDPGTRKKTAASSRAAPTLTPPKATIEVGSGRGK